MKRCGDEQRLRVAAGTHGHKLRLAASYRMRSQAVWTILDSLEMWRDLAKWRGRELATMYRRGGIDGK